jgi:hypothetical protein
MDVMGERPGRSGPSRFPVHFLPMDFGGPQDFWDEHEREHRVHEPDPIVWAVIIAIFVVLGTLELVVHTAFLGFAGLVSVGALASLAMWWTTRPSDAPDGRTSDTVEVDLDDEWAPGSGPEGRR